MKNLILTSKDLGYYFLIIDMALLPEKTEQIELDFEEEEKEYSAEIEKK